MKLNKKRAAIIAVNAAAAAGAVIFFLSGRAAARSQSYNYAAERWGDGYAQISCFLPEKSEFSVDSVGTARMQLLNTLQAVSIAPKDGQKLCPDSYSAPFGQATVSSDIDGSSEAEITAVGGDFFLMRDFRLIDGAYFSGDDIMQDGAVIDRDLAWSLYGSDDISGMNIKINGVQFYISGVIDTPSTDTEKKCCGELPRAYISYSGASSLMTDGESEEAQRFSAVTCYEFIMPDPVENYAYGSMKKYFLTLDESSIVIQNTGRFSPAERLRAIKKLPDLAVMDSSVVMPYWENASRLTEYKLSMIYRRAAVCAALPLLTAAWLMFKAFRALRKNKKIIIGAVIDAFGKFFAKVKGLIKSGKKAS